MDSTSLATSQIDAVLARYQAYRARSKYDDLSDLAAEVTTEVLTLMMATVNRLAPVDSSYRQNAAKIMEQFGPTNGYCTKQLIGVLRALKADYEAGTLASLAQLVTAEVFSDFLDMADYLLNQKYKDPAAVLVGGVLEQHLRALSPRHGVSTLQGGKPRSADALNADLCKATAYTQLDHKSITAWLDLRNKAAHAQYGEYSGQQVALTLQAVRDFILRTYH